MDVLVLNIADSTNARMLGNDTHMRGITTLKYKNV